MAGFKATLVPTMRLMVASFWRAAAYCLHPKVVLLSSVPVVLLMVASGVLAHFYWQDALAGLGRWLESSVLLSTAGAWLDAVGMGGVKSMLVSLVLIVLVTPVMVICTLLLVSLVMTPRLVSLVAQRRFPALVRQHGASFLASVAWSVGSSLLALLAMVVSAPMWVVPPLVLVLPPLIWGWLTGRIMAFDALATHATALERRALLLQHRKPLLAMGLVVGLMGAAPSLLWSMGLMTLAMAPLLLPLSIWIYTLIFVFSSLWFVHFCLDALERLRHEPAPKPTPPEPSLPLGNL